MLTVRSAMMWYFVGGIGAAAVGVAIAVGPCCMSQYTILAGAGSSGDPCTGHTVRSCEEGPLSTSGPAYYKEAFPRLATCTEYKSEGTVVQSACDTTIPGWQKIPGTIGENKCCFVQTVGLTITPLSRDFQIVPCNTTNCGS